MDLAPSSESPRIAYSTIDGSTITQLKFSSRDVIYITPSPGLTTPPRVTYLDMSLDRFADWKEIAASAFATCGFVLDTSGLQPT